MRINQQQRMTVAGQLWCDCDAVRRLLLRIQLGCGHTLFTGIEFAQRIEFDLLDIAADAAFGEAQHHPRFEVRQHPGVNFWVGGEKVIEPVRPGIHQPPHLGRGPRRTSI